ncbi:diacylglycerol kinase [Shewanella avicenniae]|uniref:diacylglycerol kinase n=1 Tax=Shewanella avicenniae TaxID=2814294 RepID=UPI001E352206|nr:diacylglycerol kinase [Shewanella avicenniae]
MKNQSFIKKLGYAINGFIYAVKAEHNMRRHLAAAVIALAVFAWRQPSALWWALIVLCIALVWAAELINSAVEGLIDHLHPEIHPQIGHIKDMLAAMVLVFSLAAVVVGVLGLYSTL